MYCPKCGSMTLVSTKCTFVLPPHECHYCPKCGWIEERVEEWRRYLKKKEFATQINIWNPSRRFDG